MGEKRNRRPGGLIDINGEKLREIVASSEYSSGDLSARMNQGGSFISHVINGGQINRYACYELMGLLCIDPEDIDAFDLIKNSSQSSGQMTFVLEPPKEKKKNINEQMLDVLIEIKEELRRKNEWQQ